MSHGTGNQDWLLRASHPARFERFEAFFSGHGFDWHRHDTYAIGHTLSGVQSFQYRKSLRHSLPGRTLVLHPDEPHDGHAGTEDGFQYRIIYIEPALIQRILGGKPLPFITDGVSTDPRLYAAAAPLLRAMHTPFDTLEEDDLLYDLAHALSAAGGQRRARKTCDYRAAELARGYIHAHFEHAIALDDLALVCGRDRWSLTRDFRDLYGTSPYRYVTARRLEHCRRLMLAGMPMVDAAIAAGFADQSHMTRHFGATYGMPPGRWLAMQRRG